MVKTHKGYRTTPYRLKESEVDLVCPLKYILEHRVV